jgi:hypothetical protein
MHEFKETLSRPQQRFYMEKLTVAQREGTLLVTEMRIEPGTFQPLVPSAAPTMQFFVV